MRRNQFKASRCHHKITAGLLLCEDMLRVPPGLRETGLREGVVVAGVGVVEEGEGWAAGTASTLAANATLTDTAAATNREWT